jgi:ferric-dicitrate binding protein FerR (iron transport regulator)
MTDHFLRSLDDIREEQEALLEREMDPDMALASDYLAGELSAERSAEVRARIEKDPDFRDLIAPLLLAADHGAGRTPIPRADLERKWLDLRRQIGLSELNEKPRTGDGGLSAYRSLMKADKRRSYKLLGAMAAAIVVMAVLPSAVLWFKSRTPINTTVTQWGRTEVVSLPDGSRITLSMGSRLDHLKVSSYNQRTYRLRGEGDFNVVPNSETFSVFTESALITVTGTRFVVHAYPGEPTQVSVTEGTVVVQPLNAEQIPFGEQLKLTPGMKARLVQGFPAERIP